MNNINHPVGYTCKTCTHKEQSSHFSIQNTTNKSFIQVNIFSKNSTVSVIGRNNGKFEKISDNNLKEKIRKVYRDQLDRCKVFQQKVTISRLEKELEEKLEEIKKLKKDLEDKKSGNTSNNTTFTNNIYNFFFH